MGGGAGLHEARERDADGHAGEQRTRVSSDPERRRRHAQTERHEVGRGRARHGSGR